MPEVGAATAIGRASTATDDSPWIGEARVRGPAGGAGGRGRRGERKGAKEVLPKASRCFPITPSTD